MDAVNVFNSELAGLYECKPPISKAKMTAITKAAIRGIKFYKHVVQSVEKFLQKCKTEYKIPGLYVIDSIVRQSRHQFSTEKDVFAPRFAKNILVTFFYIFKCPVEDKSKVIRVLNLWQKNHVFGEEIIQPLFDLANPSHPIQKEIGNQIAQKGNKSKSQQQNISQTAHHHTPQQHTPTYQHTPQQQQPVLSQSSNQHVQQHNVNSIGNPMISASHANQGNTSASVVTAFDQNLIQQLQQILMTTDDAGAVAALGLPTSNPPPPIVSQHISSHQHIPPPVVTLPSMPDSKLISGPGMTMAGDYDGRSLQFMPVDTSLPPPGYNTSFANNPPQPILGLVPVDEYSPPQPMVQSPREEGERTDDSEDNKENQVDRESDRHRRSRSRSFSRSKRSRRRSRSSSRSRYKRSRSRGRRSRSRDRDRDRDRDRRDRDRDRGGRRRDRERIDREKEQELEKSREKERERKKKGLPPMKDNHLSVCSTTLWVGHLSKLVQQDELSDIFGEYGDIVEINLIPPRGCAFVCMNRRQDASRALTKLRGHKIHNKAITTAWAPGMGVNGKDFKDYWEVDVGCSYIPYSKLSTLSSFDIDALEEGGMIDEESVPASLKGRIGISLPNVNLPPPTLQVPPTLQIPPTLQPPPSLQPQMTHQPSLVHQPPPSQMIHPNLLVQPPTNTHPDHHSLVRPMGKDIRGGLSLPPPIMPPFGMPNIPPPGLQMGAPIMSHLGVPPPMAAMNMPPVSSMLGQPLIRIPAHISLPPVSLSSQSQDSDSAMDVEMEDVEKSDSLIDTKDSLEDHKREDDFNINKDKLSLEFRNDQMGVFNSVGMQRPPCFSQLGMLPGNAPNFGPRGLPNMSGFNGPRGLLVPPPRIGDPRGMRPMAPMLAPRMAQGMMINRFSSFPRFGVISEQPPMIALPTEPPPAVEPMEVKPPERKERSRWSDVVKEDEKISNILPIDIPPPAPIPQDLPKFVPLYQAKDNTENNDEPKKDDKSYLQSSEQTPLKSDDKNSFSVDCNLLKDENQSRFKDENRKDDKNMFKENDRPRFRDDDRHRFRDNDRNRFRDDDRSRFRDDDRNRFRDNDRSRFNDNDRNRFKDDDRNRFKDGDRNRSKDEDRNRSKDEDRNRFNEPDRNHYKDDRSRFKDDDRNRFKDDDRNRFKDDDRNRYKGDDRNRFKDEDKSRFKDEDRSRIKDEDKNRLKDEDRNRFKGEDRNRFKDEDRNRFKNDDNKINFKDNNTREDNNSMNQFKDEHKQFTKDNIIQSNVHDQNLLQHNDINQFTENTNAIIGNTNQFRDDEYMNPFKNNGDQFIDEGRNWSSDEDWSRNCDWDNWQGNIQDREKDESIDTDTKEDTLYPPGTDEERNDKRRRHEEADTDYTEVTTWDQWSSMNIALPPPPKKERKLNSVTSSFNNNVSASSNSSHNSLVGTDSSNLHGALDSIASPMDSNSAGEKRTFDASDDQDGSRSLKSDSISNYTGSLEESESKENQTNAIDSFKSDSHFFNDSISDRNKDVRSFNCEPVNESHMTGMNFESSFHDSKEIESIGHDSFKSPVDIKSFESDEVQHQSSNFSNSYDSNRNVNNEPVEDENVTPDNIENSMKNSAISSSSFENIEPEINTSLTNFAEEMITNQQNDTQKSLIDDESSRPVKDNFFGIEAKEDYVTSIGEVQNFSDLNNENELHYSRAGDSRLDDKDANETVEREDETFDNRKMDSDIVNNFDDHSLEDDNPNRVSPFFSVDSSAVSLKTPDHYQGDFNPDTHLSPVTEIDTENKYSSPHHASPAVEMDNSTAIDPPNAISLQSGAESCEESGDLVESDITNE